MLDTGYMPKFRNEKKNSDWSLKMEMEERLDKFEANVEATNTKVSSNLHFIHMPPRIAPFSKQF